MAYTSVSKTDEGNLVRVQLPSSALIFPPSAYKSPAQPFFGITFGITPVYIFVFSIPALYFELKNMPPPDVRAFEAKDIMTGYAFRDIFPRRCV